MRQLVLLFVITLLSACATPPSSVILSPELITPAQVVTPQGSVDLQVIDNRKYHHVLQMTDGSEQQNLINANRQPKLIVSEALSQSLKHHGYQLSPTAPMAITVEIEQMLIKLNQHRLKYDTDNHIVLKVIIGSNTKTFTTKGSSHGPLSADVAVLERIFNQQLGELISKITNDSEILKLLKQ